MADDRITVTDSILHAAAKEGGFELTHTTKAKAFVTRTIRNMLPTLVESALSEAVFEEDAGVKNVDYNDL